MKCYYKSDYKYQLCKTFYIQTNIIPEHPIVTSYIKLADDGFLTIHVGYAWDGPSGPTIDTTDFIAGSLVHDALYQLMRLELLSIEHRLEADMELERICIERGMSKIRARWVYCAVRMFGEGAALSINKNQVKEA